MARTTIENLAAGLDVFTSNVFLVSGERPVLIDAGSNFDVVEAIESRNVELEALVLTHTHPDHVGNAAAITQAFGVESWGFDTSQSAVDNSIADEEWIQMGSAEFQALHTPGHKDDHLCFYSPDEAVFFAADLIFQNGGFGRTDFPEGDRVTLVRSIERIAELLDSNLQTMHCGHGPSISDDPYSHVQMALRMARG